MKNSIQLFVSALILTVFWFVVYFFATNILAIYLASLFALISLVVGCLILFKGILLITGQSRSILYKIDKRKFSQKQLYNTISKTA
jgi:hypothetical protein